MIYLDNAATMKPLPCAIRAFNRVIKRHYGNPHSVHGFGMDAHKILEQSRETIARCVGCKPGEVYFTSGATEACNWALEILKNHCTLFLTDGTEHAAIAQKIEHLNRTEPHKKKSHGYAHIVTLVNNETGKLARLPEREHKDDLIFADATAAIGNCVRVAFDTIGIDYMAFGAHKFGGIPGIGCLIVKHGAPIEPLIYGGGEEKRAGTPCVALVAAMAAALDYKTATASKRAKKLEKCRAALIHGLDGVEKTEISRDFLQAGNILSITFRGVPNTALVAMMSERFGTMISAGAACNGGSPSSLVLMAQGYSEQDAENTIRISLTEQNTVRECRKAAKQLKFCVEQIRKII